MLPYTFQHTANLPAFRKALFPAPPIFPTSDLDFQSFFIVPLFPYSCNVFSCKFKKKHHFSVLLQKAPSAAVISVRRKALMSRCLLKRFAYPIQMALRNQAVVVESKVLHAHAARRAHLVDQGRAVGIFRRKTAHAEQQLAASGEIPLRLPNVRVDFFRPRAPCNDRRSRWTAGNPASRSARFRSFHGDPPFRDIRPPI